MPSRDGNVHENIKAAQIVSQAPDTTVPAGRDARSAPAREGDGPLQQGDSVFSLRCEHCLLLFDCTECSKTTSLAELRRQYRVFERQHRERMEARRVRVIQLNDELDAD